MVNLTLYLKVLINNDMDYGYNAATDRYEDLMKAGILDPSKVYERSSDLFDSLVLPFRIFFKEFDQISRKASIFW